MNLSDKALLVQLNISHWAGRRVDKRVNAEIAVKHNASLNAGNYSKHLMPNSERLGRIDSKKNLIRQEFYKNTLPWGLDGTFILPTSNYLGFMNEFRKHKSEWQYLVDDFVGHYLMEIAAAQRMHDALGNLYDPSDYPDADRIHTKFAMDLAILPVPSTDFRVSIASEELTRIQEDVARRVEDAGKLAMQEVWKRMYDKVQHMAEKLADPKAIFRDTLVENLQEQCQMLSRLNFADDPDLENMRMEVESKLVLHPDALRNDPDLRREKAKEAAAIASAMGAFMGGV
jgi:hypothetical protein